MCLIVIYNMQNYNNIIYCKRLYIEFLALYILNIMSYLFSGKILALVQINSFEKYFNKKLVLYYSLSIYLIKKYKFINIKKFLKYQLFFLIWYISGLTYERKKYIW